MFPLLVFFSLFGLILGDFNLLILHNNDIHARLQQVDRNLGICENDTSTKCYGGFARMQNTVLRLKQEAADKGWPTVFLNAGDTFQGTPFYTYFKWTIMSQFVSMLDLDVMSLGNHEFDDGIPGLAPYIRNVSVPIVACNLDISEEPDLDHPNLTPSKILNVNGVNIGIIGYLTPETVSMKGTGKLRILDEITSIRAEAAKLLQQNTSILIALGHSGYIKDQEIANEVEEIDVVVGGHSHTFLYTGKQPDSNPSSGPYPTVVTQSSGKKVPVVQAYWGTKYLGYLNLTFDDNGNLKTFSGNPILLRGNMSQDPNILMSLQPYEEKVYAKVNQILGYTNVLLDSTSCRQGECNLGNLIADAFVDYATRYNNGTKSWTPAAIGLIQAGGIRASINTQTNNNHNGSITLGDLMTVLPWGNKIVILNMTGSVLRDALELAMALYGENKAVHGLQVSGIHVVYDVNRTAGSRVVGVTALCASCRVPVYKPLMDNQTYGVVMPDYLAQGGGTFTMFANLTNPNYLGDVDFDVVAQYIKQQGLIYPALDGRITIVRSSSNTTKSSASSFFISRFMWPLIFLICKMRLSNII